jgi:hypothetical protein
MLERTSSIPEDRPLTDEERRLTRWMLEHGTPDAATFLVQLQTARVISRCPCGCASIDFSIAGQPRPFGPLQILADFEFGDENNLCGAFVFAVNGVLAGLEVCGYAVDAPRELPKTELLRPLSA